MTSRSAADFLLVPSPQKAKLKLGKGKQVASNATNTSFTAKCESTRISEETAQ